MIFKFNQCEELVYGAAVNSFIALAQIHAQLPRDFQKAVVDMIGASLSKHDGANVAKAAVRQALIPLMAKTEIVLNADHVNGFRQLYLAERLFSAINFREKHLWQPVQIADGVVESLIFCVRYPTAEELQQLAARFSMRPEDFWPEIAGFPIPENVETETTNGESTNV